MTKPIGQRDEDWRNLVYYSVPIVTAITDLHIMHAKQGTEIPDDIRDAIEKLQEAMS